MTEPASRSLDAARDLREYADALDKDRGHSKSRVTTLMRAAADELDRLRNELAIEPRAKLEPPYCQVIGRNAAVLLTREQIERVAREMDQYPITADLACSIGAEMRRALIALDYPPGAKVDV